MPNKPSKKYYVKLFFGALEDTFQIKRFLPYWLPIWLWMAFIYYVSHQSDVAGIPSKLGYLWHIFAFTLLVLLVYRAFRSYSFSKKDAYAIAASWTIIYAIIDEIHQIFVPYRTFSGLDILLDLIGTIFFGIILLSFFNKTKNKDS
jgi:VanZ family protein